MIRAARLLADTVAAVALVLLASGSPGGAWLAAAAQPAAEPEAAPQAAPAPAVAVDPAPLELGRTTYVKQCPPCHGAEGRGDGEAAYLLYPRPRNFTTARFKLVSTWE